MTITILGRPISKKNSKQIIRVGRFSKIIPSEAYTKFEADALDQLVQSKLTSACRISKKEVEYKPIVKPFDQPVEINYTFHMKGKLDSDGDNMEAGINDILQKSGLLLNDSLILRWHGEKIPGNTDWKTVITIKEYAPTILPTTSN